MGATRAPLTCREAHKRLGRRVAILTGGTVHEGRLTSYTLDPETGGVLCATLEIGGSQTAVYAAGGMGFFVQGAGWRGSRGS